MYAAQHVIHATQYGAPVAAAVHTRQNIVLFLRPSLSQELFPGIRSSFSDFFYVWCLLFAGSEQHAWLLADLAAVDRSVTPWVIVGGHRPIYIASTFNMPDQGDQPVAIALRAAFEEAFVEHRVSKKMQLNECWKGI